MVMIKEKIGRRIRELRELKQMTREMICRDESQLTARQLARIEAGQSLPSLVKLDYIASQLGIDLSDLVGGQQLDIPVSYFEAKRRLIKFPSYGNTERMQEKARLIEEIYANYFDILPEEELLTLELLECIQDHRLGGRIDDIELIFDDYFHQLQLKKIYEINDLLLASYFLMKCTEEKNCPQWLVDAILSQELRVDDYYNFCLLATMMSVSDVYLTTNKFILLKEVVDKMNTIIDVSLQHTLKPVVTMLEAKYYRFAKNDRVKAAALYDLAILLARTFGDKILEKNIVFERDRDLSA